MHNAYQRATVEKKQSDGRGGLRKDQEARALLTKWERSGEAHWPSACADFSQTSEYTILH